jgi:hypothetical protein
MIQDSPARPVRVRRPRRLLVGGFAVMFALGLATHATAAVFTEIRYDVTGGTMRGFLSSPPTNIPIVLYVLGVPRLDPRLT